MKKNIDKEKSQEMYNKYHNCKNWKSELETFIDGTGFMKKTIFKFLTKIEEHKKIELRTFFNELEGRFRGRLDWLLQKIELHELQLKSSFKDNYVQRGIELQARHDLLKREVKQLKENYSTMREDFFNLLKPCLRKRSESSQSAQAA